MTTLQFTGPIECDVSVTLSNEEVEINGKTYTGAKVSCEGFKAPTNGQCVNAVSSLPATHRPNYPATFKLFGRYGEDVEFTVTIQPDGSFTVDMSKFAPLPMDTEFELYPFDIQYLLAAE